MKFKGHVLFLIIKILTLIISFIVGRKYGFPFNILFYFLLFGTLAVILEQQITIKIYVFMCYGLVFLAGVLELGSFYFLLNSIYIPSKQASGPANIGQMGIFFCFLAFLLSTIILFVIIYFIRHSRDTLLKLSKKQVEIEESKKNY